MGAILDREACQVLRVLCTFLGDRCAERSLGRQRASSHGPVFGSSRQGHNGEPEILAARSQFAVFSAVAARHEFWGPAEARVASSSYVVVPEHQCCRAWRE